MEGRLWPLVVALVLSAVVGISLGWWLLGRSKAPASSPTEASLQLPASLPPAEVDQRQQLLNRLRALQVNRGWFLKLVDASLLAQYPERGGRLPGDSLEDAPFRKVWNELAEEWLARVEALPLALRSRLGDFTAADWEAQQRRLAAQGLSPAVLRQLVSGNAQALLPGRSGQDIPPSPCGSSGMPPPSRACRTCGSNRSRRRQGWRGWFRPRSRPAEPASSRSACRPAIGWPWG